MSEASSRHSASRRSPRPDWTSTFESQHRKMLIISGFQKPYIQRSVWTQKRNTTQRPNNLKFKTERWNDRQWELFLLSVLYAASFLHCSAPTAMENGRMLRTWGGPPLYRGGSGVNEEGAEQEGKEGCYKRQYSEQQTFQWNKALGMDSCYCLPPLGLPLFVFYYSNKINYKRV